MVALDKSRPPHAYSSRKIEQAVSRRLTLLAKFSKNLLVITQIFTLSPNFNRHLRSRHLGLVYNDPSDFDVFGSTL